MTPDTETEAEPTPQPDKPPEKPQARKKEQAQLPPEQEERIVDKVVRKVKEVLGASGEVAEEGESGGSEEGEQTGSEDDVPSSPRQVEASTEGQVREALRAIQAEEQHAQEHERIKKETERQPVSVSRITRAIWGEP